MHYQSIQYSLSINSIFIINQFSIQVLITFIIKHHLKSNITQYTQPVNQEIIKSHI